MPNLPTVSINNQAIYDRLVAAFGNSADAYRAWLKEALTQEVLHREQRALLQAAQAQAQIKADEFTALVRSEWPEPPPASPAK